MRTAGVGASGRSRPPLRRRVLRAVLRSYAALVVRGVLRDGQGVPSPAGRYGPDGGVVLPLVVLGDSSAVTVGVRRREETVGAHLAEVLVSELSCAVELEVPARAGATTATMSRQVRKVTHRTDPGVALILIGGNDVMLPAPLGRAAARLGRYVAELRAAGWQVVVGSCADIGAAPALRRGVRAVASSRSRRLARLQAAAVLRAGGLVVSLTTDAFRTRPAQLYCDDGFHPSAAGYLHYAHRFAVGLLEASRASLKEPGRPSDGDVLLAGAVPASRRVVSAPGACFIPAPSQGPVVMRPYVPAATPGSATSVAATPVAAAPVPARR
ncbi:SGNH/GDSL hydrolase family protein [Streptomyces sp. NPDC002701]|uniref:SGNH/GDSL hydrolase family protein n=1 Tax=Streptomyces sp. NPDC002701 TaxID=3364661 RepID=UPI00368D7FFA